MKTGQQRPLDALDRQIAKLARGLDDTLTRVATAWRARNAGSGRPPLKHSRATLLFLLPLHLLAALVVSLAKGSILKVIVDAAGLALLLYAGILARRGLAEEALYRYRKVANPPRIPLKTIAAGLIALVCMLVAHLSAGHSLVLAVLTGVCAFLGFYLVYGLDPRKRKQTKVHPGVSSEQLVSALDEGYRDIAAIDAASARIHNIEFRQRLARITALAERILSHIEDDPRNLRRARKFLNVYLDGTQQVTEGYARTHGSGQTRELEANFRRALISIEQVFEEQYRKLQENNLLDLDVQIEVLRNQLEREGVL